MFLFLCEREVSSGVAVPSVVGLDFCGPGGGLEVRHGIIHGGEAWCLGFLSYAGWDEVGCPG